ncbi:LRAT domain-containing protein [Hirschfeldia incana]|nr:LRAT domain-containing protein [Hirschfeldia incana]
MGVFSNKISREEVKTGDHIYTWRAVHTYAHHGIYVGDGKVVHFTSGRGPQTETRMLVSSSSTSYPLCLICKDHYSFEGFKVTSSCLDCFLAGGNLYLYQYNVSMRSFLAKPIGGTCTLEPSGPPEDVLFRANFQLQHLDGWFGDYHLQNNNCEDFAIYCKTGLLVYKKNKYGNSGQVNAVAAASAALVVNACGLTMVGVGVYCYARVRRDVSSKRMKGKVIEVSAKKLVSILESDCTSPREGWLSIAGSKFFGKQALGAPSGTESREAEHA